MTRNQQKFKIRTLLRRRARSAQRRGRPILPLTYGELAVGLGYDARAAVNLGPALGLVGYDCIARGEPCLNVLVVNAITRVPGQGVVVTARRSIKGETKAVRVHKW